MYVLFGTEPILVRPVSTDRRGHSRMSRDPATPQLFQSLLKIGRQSA